MVRANCNWWQYARWVYLVGRSGKYKAFTAAEKEACIAFIQGILANRPWLEQIINGCLLNVKYTDDMGFDFSKQNWYSIAKMLQKIGKDLKIIPPIEEEKVLCDTLFSATDGRRHQFVKVTNYQTEDPAAESSEDENQDTNEEAEEITQE